MKKEHRYEILNEWTGNHGAGTSNYEKYSRNHELSVSHKVMKIPGSSDPNFRGDKGRYNPEELLVSSISACHMLWYLHLCSVNDVIVNSYIDYAEGIMIENEDSSGKFDRVYLKPSIVVASKAMIKRAIALHQAAHEMCFIANSCNFIIECHPKISVVKSA